MKWGCKYSNIQYNQTFILATRLDNIFFINQELGNCFANDLIFIFIASRFNLTSLSSTSKLQNYSNSYMLVKQYYVYVLIVLITCLCTIYLFWSSQKLSKPHVLKQLINFASMFAVLEAKNICKELQGLCNSYAKVSAASDNYVKTYCGVNKTDALLVVCFSDWYVSRLWFWPKAEDWHGPWL